MADLEALKADLTDKQIAFRGAIEALVAVTGESFTPFAPHLSDAQVVNCRVVPSRYHILDYMPKDAVCAEVGTQAGNFAIEILKRTNPRKLHLVDLCPELFEKREQLADDFESGRIVFHEGYSQQVLQTFDDQYFDWIYIDADHSYAGFVEDLRVSAKKLKPNGYIVCNDYTVWSPGEAHPYGILQGVNEFAVEDNWEFVFFGLHGQGYHDVCIRKRV